MHTLPVMVAKIKEYETGPKLKRGEPALKAYRCPSGRWTIGWGATGKGIGPKTVINRSMAEQMFATHLSFFEHGVLRAVNGGAPTSIEQFSALVSFAYNCGLDEDDDTKAEGLGDSTLLKLHRAGSYLAAADEFPKWTSGGMGGLIVRRAFERSLYLSGSVSFT